MQFDFCNQHVLNTLHYRIFESNNIQVTSSTQENLYTLLVIQRRTFSLQRSLTIKTW